MVACGAALLSYYYLGRVNRVEWVVTAVTDIPLRTRIDASMVTRRPVPVSAIHPLAARGLDQVVGRYSTHDLFSGEQVIESRLSAEGKTHRYVADIKRNQRAVIIPLKAGDGVGGSVRTGDLVDIIMACDEKLLGEPLVRTIAWKIRVLDVVREPGGAFVNRPNDGQPIAIILEVSPAEAERILFAVQYGQVFFSVNGYGSESGNTPGVSVDNIFVPGVSEQGQ